MKNFITPALLKFALTAAVLAIVFRCFLSYGIEQHSTTICVLSGALYGVAMFALGWYFGKKDADYLPIFDVGFRFHFATYLVHNLISELWFLLNFSSGYEKIWSVHLTATIWGVVLLLHFLLFLWTRKKAINGLDKKELFE